MYVVIYYVYLIFKHYHVSPDLHCIGWFASQSDAVGVENCLVRIPS